ncbi:hypothetical protein [Streptomyces sp. PvR034]|uniref:hypothetical protein n=1 Tax=Streptomyces sp. PvR034 TaxID=3156401 RepID=UPI00339A346A
MSACAFRSRPGPPRRPYWPWFGYEPTPGDVQVRVFAKNQSLTGKFYPLRHLHVDG